MKTVILVACLLGFGAARGAPVPVLLPGLTGDYDSGFVAPENGPRSRTVEFTIPPAVTSVERIQVVMSGVWRSDAWEICEYDIGGGLTVLDTLPIPPQMRLVLTAPTLNGGCFFGTVNFTTPTVDEGSDWIHDCAVGEPLDLNLLLGATIQADLECNFAPRCEPYLDAETSLNSVYLNVIGQTVADDRLGWGSIKALYR